MVSLPSLWSEILRASLWLRLHSPVYGLTCETTDLIFKLSIQIVPFVLDSVEWEACCARRLKTSVDTVIYSGLDKVCRTACSKNCAPRTELALPGGGLARHYPVRMPNPTMAPLTSALDLRWMAFVR